MMFRQGKYKVKNVAKYLGDPSNVIYRSSWELRVMKFLDSSPSVKGWASEPFAVPYVSPIDGRVHRYVVDFMIEVEKNGVKRIMILEVKPRNQGTLAGLKKITNANLERVLTVSINQAKWEAARAVCAKKGWQFKVIEEKDLGLDI